MAQDKTTDELNEFLNDLLESTNESGDNLQPHQQQQQQGDDDEQGLHPISCAYCRKNHRKCDRKKPSCTNCVRKGVICNYTDPLKKGRKKKSEKEVIVVENNHDEEKPKKSSGSSSGSNNSTTPPGAVPYKSVHVDSDDVALKRSTFDLFALLDIPIQKSEFENYFNMAISGMLHDDIIYALLFAAQALIDQRLGEKEASKLSFNKARKLIQPHFDNIDNINVGFVFFLFCSFEASNANYRKVALYFNILKTFVDEIDTMENANIKLTPQMKKLKNYTRFIAMNMSTSQDIDCNNPLAIAKMFPKLVFAATGVNGFAELCEKLEHLEKDRLEEHLAAVDSACLFMNNHMRQLDEHGDRKNVIDLMSCIVKNGMKLASYLSVDNDNWEKIVLYATNITTATENPLFVFLPAPSVSHVAMASKQHLRLWSLIKLGMVPDFFQGRNILEQLIYQSYRALSILSTRFDRVQKYYSDLYQELEHFVKEYFTQQPQNEAAQQEQQQGASMIIHNNNTNTTTLNEPLLQDLLPEGSFVGMLDESFFYEPTH